MLSRRFMAPDTASQTSDDQALGLKWSNRVSLTPRILAVNIFALALLGGGFSYLDSYRSRMVDSRVEQAGREARLIAQALASTNKDAKRRDLLVLSLARDMATRIRLYDDTGKLLADSRELGLRNGILRDPDKDPWGLEAARWLDAAVDHPAAIAVEIGEAAAEQRQREDVDRKNPWRQADAVRPFQPEGGIVIRRRSGIRRHRASR